MLNLKVSAMDSYHTLCAASWKTGRNPLRAPYENAGFIIFLWRECCIPADMNRLDMLGPMTKPITFGPDDTFTDGECGGCTAIGRFVEMITRCIENVLKCLNIVNIL
jgi:hypothetical protein